MGERHPWKRVRLMEPVGEVYPLKDDAVPARVKKIFAEKPNTKALVQKGFRHIPPPDLKAIIKWRDEGSRFRYACGEGLHQYISGQVESEAVAIIESLSLKIPISMEILDHSLGREEVITGIAQSVTKLSLNEKNEEVLQALADLEMGNVERVNDYLSPYYRDIDTFAFNLDGKENVIIRDEKELLRRIRERINQVVSMQPSYPDTKRVRREYLVRIFSNNLYSRST